MNICASRVVNNFFFIVVFSFLFINYSAGSLHSQQIDIPRIAQMPKMPVPYEMRNWKQAAIEYDRFVFDFDATGQFLPLIWWRTNTINYPAQISFGLHTVVGTTAPGSAEAINVLPAVISASLVGIDKSNQNGTDWVSQCREYFNKHNGAGVYLNHPGGSGWDDWWYDTMPNVFFYQLFDLYPETVDFSYQLKSVASRWLTAVEVMGGGTTPWRIPYMNYRAFNLMTMTPVSAGVKEPEAAGAIGWLLYAAYQETGHQKYRTGAEWCLEFLSGLSSNPAYELQLAYGVYTAARMNAELFTEYPIEKMVNWCFEVGPLRSWGAIVGNWGGYDCSGLIGEVNGSNDYAFIMNTFEKAGALVPLVRYDERFAAAIARWILNAASAARLFYSDFLPDINQDGEWWSQQYDTASVIAHEAMRQYDIHQPSVSPFATGDAVTGGWGETNFALYGSSHVGIFGGIIDTTNIRGILKLDLLKTDYFRAPAYPSYLLYNPYDRDTLVTFAIESGLYDLYESISNQLIDTNVEGEINLPVPAEQAVLLVLIPPGGTISYELGRLLINGIVVDYNTDQIVGNYPPRIKSLAATMDTVLIDQTVDIYCTAEDREGDTLSYFWEIEAGGISGEGNHVSWTAPSLEGDYHIYCLVTDREEAKDSSQLIVKVLPFINHPPAISGIEATPRKIDLGKVSELSCQASDRDGDRLSYVWSAAYGSVTSDDSTASWNAPDSAGNYFVCCAVTDERGEMVTDSIELMVRDFSLLSAGQLIAYYPFNGDASDQGEHGYHGIVSGAVLTQDRYGNSNHAYLFDGINDHIRVTNHDSLNFQQAISVNFWMQIGELYNRESFPLSHGSWENRWKVSLIPERKLRWTINTTSGIKDLDSEMLMQTGMWYNITVYYDGSDMELWINGQLDSFVPWSGQIKKTSHDFMMAQRLHNDYNYNFKGVLDDVRLFDFGLPPDTIQALYDELSDIPQKYQTMVFENFQLRQNYPNPFNATTTITFQIPEAAVVQLKIYDVSGREIKVLLDQKLSAGRYEVQWEAHEMASGVYFYRFHTEKYEAYGKMILLR